MGLHINYAGALENGSYCVPQKTNSYVMLVPIHEAETKNTVEKLNKAVWCSKFNSG